MTRDICRGFSGVPEFDHVPAHVVAWLRIRKPESRDLTSRLNFESPDFLAKWDGHKFRAWAVVTRLMTDREFHTAPRNS